MATLGTGWTYLFSCSKYSNLQVVGKYVVTNASAHQVKIYIAATYGGTGSSKYTYSSSYGSAYVKVNGETIQSGSYSYSVGKGTYSDVGNTSAITLSQGSSGSAATNVSMTVAWPQHNPSTTITLTIPAGAIDSSYYVSAATGPTSLTISGQDSKNRMKPGQNFTVSCSGAKDGNSNSIYAYSFYWKIGGPPSEGDWHGWNGYVSGTASSGASTTFNFNCDHVDLYNKRGGQVYIGVIACAGSYNASMVTKATGVYINSLPSTPSVSASADTVKSSGDSVKFTISAGSDSDGHSCSVRYATSNVTPTTSNTTAISSGTSLTVKSTSTYYFWTYDGLEFSSGYQANKITVNGALQISNPTWSFYIKDGNSSTSLAKSFGFTGSYTRTPTKFKYLLKWGSSSSITSSSTTSYTSSEISGSPKSSSSSYAISSTSIPEGYYFIVGLAVYDGLEWSGYTYSSVYRYRKSHSGTATITPTSVIAYNSKSYLSPNYSLSYSVPSVGDGEYYWNSYVIKGNGAEISTSEALEAKAAAQTITYSGTTSAYQNNDAIKIDLVLTDSDSVTYTSNSTTYYKPALPTLSANLVSSITTLYPRKNASGTVTSSALGTTFNSVYNYKLVFSLNGTDLTPTFSGTGITANSNLLGFTWGSTSTSGTLLYNIFQKVKALTSTQNGRFTLTLTDSFGQTASISSAITIDPRTQPYISSSNIYLKGTSAALTSSNYKAVKGEQVQITFTPDDYNVADGMTKTLNYQITSSNPSIIPSTSGTCSRAASTTQYLTINNVSAATTVTLTLTLSDNLGTTSNHAIGSTTNTKAFQTVTILPLVEPLLKIAAATTTSGTTTTATVSYTNTTTGCSWVDSARRTASTYYSYTPTSVVYHYITGKGEDKVLSGTSLSITENTVFYAVATYKYGYNGTQLTFSITSSSVTAYATAPLVAYRPGRMGINVLNPKSLLDIAPSSSYTDINLNQALVVNGIIDGGTY